MQVSEIHLRRFTLSSLALGLSLLAACDGPFTLDSAGGADEAPLDAADGSGTGFVQDLSTIINQGTMTVPNKPPELVPLGPHPLGRDEITLKPRSEVFVAMAQRNGFSGDNPVLSVVHDDPSNGHLPIPGTVEDTGSGLPFVSVVSGQFDEDAESEMIGATVMADHSGLVLYRGDRDDQGVYAWSLLGEHPVPDIFEGVVEGELSTGDFDQDGRDEIVVISRRLPQGFPGTPSEHHSVVDVLDDPEAGLGSMLSFVRDGNHQGMFGIVGDFNGDSVEDLVVGLEGDSTAPERYAVRTYLGERATSELALANNWQYLSVDLAVYSQTVVAGEFDGTPGDELAHFSWHAGGGATQSTYDDLGLRLFDYELASGFQLVPGSSRTWGLDGYEAPWRNTMGDAVALDRFDDGIDEIAVLNPGISGHEIFLFDWDPAGQSYSIEGVAVGREVATDQDFRNVKIAAADGDADGRQELYLAMMSLPSFGTQTLAYGWMDSGDDPVVHWSPDRTYSFDFGGYPYTGHPILAPGDYDADGFTLRSTGNDKLLLSDPVPLVLMTAAPTQEGTGQNLSGTSTSYSQSDGMAQSFGVTSSSTWSVSLGFEASDLFDVAGVAIKGTVAGAMASTDTKSTSTTYSTVYASGPEEDVLHFQALVYRSYEYEVLSSNNPALIGNYISLDIPIGSQSYLWTADFYETNFQGMPDVYQIDPSLRAHTVGQVASYPSRSDLETLVTDNVGWIHPGNANVSQGSTSIQLGIALNEEMTSEEQLEQTLSAELEFKVGFLTVGGSVGTGEGEVYSVTTSSETAYTGSVGGIDQASFNEWAYSWGLAVYQAGREADPITGEPLPGADPVRPVTVISFWTDPYGTGY